MNEEWISFHNEEFHSVSRSPYIVRGFKSRRLRWAGHIAIMKEGRSAFKILTGKGPLGSPRRRRSLLE